MLKSITFHIKKTCLSILILPTKTTKYILSFISFSTLKVYREQGRSTAGKCCLLAKLVHSLAHKATQVQPAEKGSERPVPHTLHWQAVITTQVSAYHACASSEFT